METATDPRASTDQHVPPPDPLGGWGILLLGLYMVVLPIILASLTIAFWPYVQSPPNVLPAVFSSWLLDRMGLPATLDLLLMIIVLTSGALGSYIHSATSFADYVGNRKIAVSWVWWYILRTFIGLTLAMIFYFVLRGGLLTASPAPESINPFGIAAVSGMAGMFSKQAADKLREVFDTLFKTEKPVERADDLGTLTPTIHTVTPASGAVGVPITLTISGDKLTPRSLVAFKGEPQPTSYVGPTQITAQIPATALIAPGTVQVTVVNPPTEGGASNAILFTVADAVVPAPVPPVTS